MSSWHNNKWNNSNRSDNNHNRNNTGNGLNNRNGLQNKGRGTRGGGLNSIPSSRNFSPPSRGNQNQNRTTSGIELKSNKNNIQQNISADNGIESTSSGNGKNSSFATKTLNNLKRDSATIGDNKKLLDKENTKIVKRGGLVLKPGPGLKSEKEDVLEKKINSALGI